VGLLPGAIGSGGVAHASLWLVRNGGGLERLGLAGSGSRRRREGVRVAVRGLWLGIRMQVLR